jgi:hypothetical protein
MSTYVFIEVVKGNNIVVREDDILSIEEGSVGQRVELRGENSYVIARGLTFEPTMEQAYEHL